MNRTGSPFKFFFFLFYPYTFGVRQIFIFPHCKLIPCLSTIFTPVHLFLHFSQVVWWTLAVRYNYFRLYPGYYELPVTMILGATVAGMTSEGGGAVAFPVMTLLLHIDPVVARDFSLMIQSCGLPFIYLFDPK